MSLRAKHANLSSLVGSMFAALLLLALAGCATSRGPEDTDLPWATQESWEGSPAMPGMGPAGTMGGGGL